jgi:hypothetical protein
MVSFKNIMKILLFLILGICLTLSISLSLMLFGVDQTLYSWRFFSDRLNEIGVVLNTESIHKSIVKDLVDPLVESLGNGVPPAVKYMVEEAAFNTFTGNWIVNLGRDSIKAAQAVLNRKSPSLDLSLSLQTFKSNFEIILYRSGRFNPQEIQAGLREIPNQITLEEIISQEELSRIERLIKTYPVYSNALMYGLPLKFLILSFLWGSFRSGIIIWGGSFLTAGVLVQTGRMYLVENSASVARLFMSNKMVTDFKVPLTAAASGFADFLTPPLWVTFVSAFSILVGGLFLDRALKKGEFLNFLRKIKFSKKKRHNALPWS